MNPETIKELQKSEQFKEFAGFLVSEAAKLNNVSDLQVKGENPVTVAVQVGARQEAYKVLQKILEPLINFREYATITPGKEYAVDVE